LIVTFGLIIGFVGFICVDKKSVVLFLFICI
jgi:hypothetical protein